MHLIRPLHWTLSQRANRHEHIVTQVLALWPRIRQRQSVASPTSSPFSISGWAPREHSGFATTTTDRH
jgi:hypothetical protein